MDMTYLPYVTLQLRKSEHLPAISCAQLINFNKLFLPFASESDPRMNFPGMPWIGLLVGIRQFSDQRKSRVFWILRHFLGDSFWGARIAFSGNVKLICWEVMSPTEKRHAQWQCLKLS